MNKPWYLSKTIWTNIVAFIATVAIIFGLDLGLDEKTQAEIVATVVAGANIILRLITNKGIKT